VRPGSVTFLISEPHNRLPIISFEDHLECGTHIDKPLGHNRILDNSRKDK